jgi:hypothetical protein
MEPKVYIGAPQVITLAEVDDKAQLEIWATEVDRIERSPRRCINIYFVVWCCILYLIQRIHFSFLACFHDGTYLRTVYLVDGVKTFVSSIYYTWEEGVEDVVKSNQLPQSTLSHIDTKQTNLARERPFT